MENERVFIVGDVHGCLNMLKRLMDKIDWRPEKDRLIFLGDYIDRGPNPKGVVEFIVGLSKISKSVQCLMGNHEFVFLDFLEHGDPNLFLMNGGLTTLRSYDMDIRTKADGLIPTEHLAFFRRLRLWLELEDYYVVHAGFRPGVDIQDQAVEDLLWIRDPFISSGYDFGKRVIFGHTPFYEPLVTDDKIGLDTGAVFGNALSCLELPRMRFHSVEV